VATAERSFSHTWLLEIGLRCRTCENRLTGSALLYIHKNINIHDKISNIIDGFASDKKNKKINFIFYY